LEDDICFTVTTILSNEHDGHMSRAPSQKDMANARNLKLGSTVRARHGHIEREQYFLLGAKFDSI